MKPSMSDSVQGDSDDSLAADNRQRTAFASDIEYAGWFQNLLRGEVARTSTDERLADYVRRALRRRRQLRWSRTPQRRR
jgi:hypothetical protein